MKKQRLIIDTYWMTTESHTVEMIVRSTPLISLSSDLDTLSKVQGK